MDSQEKKAKSKTTEWRRKIKESNPERYQELLEKDKERHRKKKTALEEFWATGTRAALCDKEAYYEQRRIVCQMSAKKRREEQNCGHVTRSSQVQEFLVSPRRVNCKIMTDEERRKHSSVVRKARWDCKSKQEKKVLRSQHATYMRNWRLKQKENFLKPPTSNPLQPSTSVPDHLSTPPSLQLSDSTNLMPSTATTLQTSTFTPLQPLTAMSNPLHVESPSPALPIAEALETVTASQIPHPPTSCKTQTKSMKQLTAPSSRGRCGWRCKLKESNPEKYLELLEKDRKRRRKKNSGLIPYKTQTRGRKQLTGTGRREQMNRHRKKKAEGGIFWASGTCAALKDKEAYYEHQRITSQMYSKRKHKVEENSVRVTEGEEDDVAAILV